MQKNALLLIVRCMNECVRFDSIVYACYAILTSPVIKGIGFQVGVHVFFPLLLQFVLFVKLVSEFALMELLLVKRNYGTNDLYILLYENKHVIRHFKYELC